jgi:hypothetical protein
VATTALFPALPLPSIVKLNTGLKVAALVQLVQTEMNQSVLGAGEVKKRDFLGLVDITGRENYICASR